MNAHVPETKDTSHRGPLALVVALGVILVILAVVLVAAIVFRGARANSGVAPYLATLAAPGARIDSTQLEGNRILVRLSGGANGDELVILDSGTGRVIGRIAVSTAP